jgi:flagellin-like hook-associated protein FlgL
MIGLTQERLSTGMAVRSAVDDAVKFFQAKSLNTRAQDLGERKDSIDQGVSTLDATLKATEAMEKLVQRMKGLIDASRSQTQKERATTAKQLSELHTQIHKLVEDASYKGLNLLNNDASKLSVRFSEKADSKIDVNGVNFKASAYLLDSDGAALGVTAGTTGSDIASAAFGFSKALSDHDFDNASQLADFNAKADTAIIRLETTINNIRAQASVMATNADILKVRLDFTKEYVDVLKGGADKLTLADLNSEGANLLALQTRQQLGIQALAFAGQSEQSVLSLFR